LPWEGEVKHRQNKGRILLPEQTFVTNAAEIITVENNVQLLREIKNKMKTDLEIQDILRKLKTGEWQDNKIALGLCKEKDGLLMYEGLIWVPQDDELCLCLLDNHHDALIAGYPGRAWTLELLARKYYWPQQW
jgi:hypothetical protein